MAKSTWIHISDPQLSSEQLAEGLKNLAQESDLRFPQFEPTLQLDAAARRRFPHLTQHLERLNQFALPETQALLMPSAAERMPLFGPLYASLRAALHALTLYYLNRHLRHLTQKRLHLLHVLNELAALRTAQEAHLQHLHAQSHDNA